MLEGGKEFIHYDKLILAPGGYPRKLPVPGIDLENVFTFRGLDDSVKVDAGHIPGSTPRFATGADSLHSRQGRKKARRDRQFFYWDGDRHHSVEAEARVDRRPWDGTSSVRSLAWKGDRSRYPKGSVTISLSGRSTTHPRLAVPRIPGGQIPFE